MALIHTHKQTVSTRVLDENGPGVIEESEGSMQGRGD